MGEAKQPKRWSSTWNGKPTDTLAFVPDDTMKQQLLELTKRQAGLFVGCTKCWFKIGAENSGRKKSD